MAEQDNGPKEQRNTLGELMKFFSTEDNPVGSGEFKTFWESLSDEEKDEFKNAELK